MKKALFLLTLLHCSIFADVVNEYRDRETESKGYISSNYLYDRDGSERQEAVETYGEYDIHKNIAWTFRYTVGEYTEDAVNNGLHIASTGLRFHYDLHEKFTVGFKTNVVHRDFNGVEGFSYRFMPIIEYRPFDFMHLRYIYEIDYIPEESFNEDFNEPRDIFEEETALYVRLKPFELFEHNFKTFDIQYELKMATGIGNDVEGNNNYGLSYEHHLFVTVTEDITLRYARVREGADYGFQTVGVIWTF